MRFRALDGLRGLCALTVALLHFCDHLHLTAPAFLANSFALVDFFFVLSGFVLAHAFFEDLAANGRGGLFVLRRTRPNAPRPYRALGYPWLPAIYIVMAVFIDVVLLLYKPQFTWPGLVIVLLGIPVYFLWSRQASDGSTVA